VGKNLTAQCRKIGHLPPTLVQYEYCGIHQRSKLSSLPISTAADYGLSDNGAKQGVDHSTPSGPVNLQYWPPNPLDGWHHIHELPATGVIEASTAPAERIIGESEIRKKFTLIEKIRFQTGKALFIDPPGEFFPILPIL